MTRVNTAFLSIKYSLFEKIFKKFLLLAKMWFKKNSIAKIFSVMQNVLRHKNCKVLNCKKNIFIDVYLKALICF